MPETFKPDIKNFIQRLELLPVTKMRELTPLLGDLSDHLFDVGEYIESIEEKTGSLNAVEREKYRDEMKELEKELEQLAKTLYQMEYEDHYMYRVQAGLDGVFEDLEELIRKLGE